MKGTCYRKGCSRDAVRGQVLCEPCRSSNKRTQYRRGQERTKYLREKRAQPCADCGGIYPPECMDFDHRPGEAKLFTIASNNRKRLSALEAEIAKCDVVCANCHRVRTTQRREVAADD